MNKKASLFVAILALSAALPAAAGNTLKVEERIDIAAPPATAAAPASAQCSIIRIRSAARLLIKPRLICCTSCGELMHRQPGAFVELQKPDHHPQGTQPLDCPI